MEVSIENVDVKVKFMHPKLPTPSLKWPSHHDDLCWVANVRVCHVVSPHELSSQTAKCTISTPVSVKKLKK